MWTQISGGFIFHKNAMGFAAQIKSIMLQLSLSEPEVRYFVFKVNYCKNVWWKEIYELVALWNIKKIHHTALSHNLGMGVKSRDEKGKETLKFTTGLCRGEDSHNMTSPALRAAKSKPLPGQLFTQLLSLNSSAVGSTSGEIRGSATFSNSIQFSKYWLSS